MTYKKVKNKLFSESPKCSDLLEEWPLGIRPPEPELLDAD